MTRPQKIEFPDPHYNREQVEYMIKLVVCQMFEQELKDDELERWKSYYTPLQTDGHGNFWGTLESIELSRIIDRVIDGNETSADHLPIEDHEQHMRMVDMWFEEQNQQ